jgi:hypothetical protein
MFEAERVERSGPGLSEYKLKNDQILQRLLFNDEQQVGLLPSHAQELEDQLTYYSNLYEGRRLSVLVEAKQQFLKLRRSPVALQLFSERNLGESVPPEKRKRAAELLEKHAPALIMLLREPEDNSRARIKDLIDPRLRNSFHGCRAETTRSRSRPSPLLCARRGVV